MAEDPIKTEAQQAPEEKVPQQPVAEEKPQVPQESENKEETDDADDYDTATKSLIPQENYRQSPLFYEMANYFGLDEREYPQAVEKLSLIVDWAISETKSNKLEDILTKVRQVERRLTPPTWGERRYAKVYGYLRLATKMNAFKQALKAFENGVEG